MARSPLRGAVAALTLMFIACDTPAVQWLDDAPQATAQPSPLSGPVATLDSTLADSTARAAFLLTQDRLREAGGTELVVSHLDSTPAAAEPTLTATQGIAAPSGAATTGTAGTTGAATTDVAMEGGAMPPGSHMMPAAPASALGVGTAPADSARCARSLRFADAPRGGRVAVWWSKRDRGRVMLLAAWRDAAGDSAVWRGPITVDSLDQGPLDAQAADRGAVGCARSAPSVVVDSVNHYVHVAYALVGPEGAGVFYAHQMDPRAQFESPKAIVYGDHLGAARVAALGDLVAVAYDDPNSGARSRVSVAISRTAGHDFADRLVASSDNANARDPYVAVRGRAVVVGWSDLPVAGGDTTFRIRRARVK